MNETIAVNDLQNAPDAYKVIDIRKQPDAKQIPGSLRYDGDRLERATDLPFDKSEDVVIYCGSGNSCRRVAQTLRDKGYTKARALEGGYQAWCDAGLPVEEIGDIREF
ncbi:MAG: rhodanese-like domain-containing protein [Vulcanimicrobiaceae bacterium]